MSTVLRPYQTANFDAVATDEDMPLIIAVLQNDSDSDGTLDISSVSISGTPIGGSPTVNTDTGEVSFTPFQDFNGVASFRYTVVDNDGAVSQVATVEITISPINDPPVATEDSFLTNEDTPLMFDVRINDFDVDDPIEALSLELLEVPSLGITDFDVVTGLVTYTPPSEYYGVVSLTYRLIDALGLASQPTIARIGVISVNDPPVANDDDATTNEDVPISIDALSNDVDIDNEIIASSFAILNPPSFGVIDIDPITAIISYTPNENVHGTDEIIYTIKDELGHVSNAGIISIAVLPVNDAPIANPDVVSTSENSAIEIDVLANDIDHDEQLMNGSAITITAAPTSGILDVDIATGIVTYQPDTGSIGEFTFGYTVTDSENTVSNATLVTIAVLPNAIPMAGSDQVVTAEDTPVIFSLLDNDIDNDGELIPATINVHAAPESGSVEIDPNSGLATYSPALNYFGTATFSYTVADEDGGVSNTADVIVSITPVNDAPSTQNDTFDTPGNIAHSINVLLNDFDVDNNIVLQTLLITSSPLHGAIEVQSGSGVVHYVPEADYFGPDEFCYTVEDESEAVSNSACVTVAVTAISLGPSIAQVVGTQLMVQQRQANGELSEPEAYTIKGVGYTPASPDTLTSPTDTENADVRRVEYARWRNIDVPLLHQMNVNTVRLFVDPGITPQQVRSGLHMLDQMYHANMMVLMAVDDGMGDFDRITQVVGQYKNHPAILAWTVGDEWNINRYFNTTNSVLEAAEITEFAAGTVKSLDNNHPVVSSYGDINLDQDELQLEDTAHYVNNICPSIDIWSLNIARGSTFGGVFEEWASISSKPMMIGEYGTDAFESTSTVSPPSGDVNEAAQAAWIKSLWDDLSINLSAANPTHAALGGFITEWSDNWWREDAAQSQETLGVHEPNGHPDGFSNEEYLGLLTIHRESRAAYSTMRAAYAPGYLAPPRTITFSTQPDRILTNIPTFLILSHIPANHVASINQIAVNSTGNLIEGYALSIGENVIQFVMQDQSGVTTTATKTITYDPGFSTAESKLLYVATGETTSRGTIVIDTEKNAVLGLIEDRFVRGVDKQNSKLFMHDRSVISTVDHRELESPVAPLAFSDDLSTDSFLMAPNSDVVYSKNESLLSTTNLLNEMNLPKNIVTGSSFGGFRAGGPTITADGRYIFCQENPSFRIDTLDNTAIALPISSGGGSRRFVSDLAVSPDGSLLIRSAYNQAKGYLDFYDGDGFSYLGTISGVGDFIGEIVFTSDGTKAVAGSAGNPFLGGGRLTLIDSESRSALHAVGVSLADNVSIAGNNHVFASSGSRNGIDEYVISENDKLVRVRTYRLGNISSRNSIHKLVSK